MTSRQYWILAGVAALAAFIGVGVALIFSSGDNTKNGSIQIGTTTSTVTTPTFPITPSTAPGTTTTPSITPRTITPGTTLLVNPSTTAATHAPVTTRPPRTTTTTTRPPATTTSTTASGSIDVGVTATEIHLAVIADDPQTFEGMTAWQTNVNHRNALAGRKVRLDLLQTGGTAQGYRDAVQAACGRDFAIVGSFSRFDASADAAGCGAIPDLPVEAVSDGHIAGDAFPAFPRGTTTVAVGPLRWLKDHVSGCCSQYVLVPDAEPARGHTLTMVDAAAAVGFSTAGTTDVTASDPASRYDAIVTEIESTHANFAASGLGRDSTVLLRQAADGHAPGIKAWYCDASCYDAAFLAHGAAAVEKQYVAIETVPFSDRRMVAALGAYMRTTTGAGHDTSYAGLRAYVAGLLFERAARQVVAEQGKDGLTRARLVDALTGIHDFNGGGIVGTTDVGGRTPNGCYVLLRVRTGHFNRVNPSTRGSLDCGSQNLVALGP